MLKSPKKNRRRTLLWGFLSLLLTWPLLRFVRFKIPVKPKKVHITASPSSNGVILQKDFILFSRNGRHWALSRTCTHLGCTVNYQETEDILECPCHQSRFQIDSGKVIQGPAKRPLPLYAVEKSSTDTGYVVTIEG